MKRYNKIKRKIRTASLAEFVAFCFSLLIIYTIAEFISAFFGVSHDILTERFFLCVGGEVLTCGVIKIFKLKEEGET